MDNLEEQQMPSVSAKGLENRSHRRACRQCRWDDGSRDLGGQEGDLEEVAVVVGQELYLLAGGRTEQHCSGPSSLTTLVCFETRH